MEDGNIRSRLFRARTAIGFAALASRRLFNGHQDYCCYDTFSLIVQRYRIGDTGMFSFGTRLRDGGTRHMWGSDEFAFQRPLHVDSRARMEFDHRLAQSLFELPLGASAQIFEAISECNSANTDSPDVPEHVEVVMMKSAFEWLLNIKENAKVTIPSIFEVGGAPSSPTPRRSRADSKRTAGGSLENQVPEGPTAARCMGAGVLRFARGICARNCPEGPPLCLAQPHTLGICLGIVSFAS